MTFVSHFIRNLPLFSTALPSKGNKRKLILPVGAKKYLKVLTSEEGHRRWIARKLKFSRKEDPADSRENIINIWTSWERGEN